MRKNGDALDDDGLPSLVPESPDDSSDPRLDAVTTVSRRRIFTNAASNYTRHGVVLLVMLFLQGYVIRTLGRTEYSVWPVIVTVTTFAALVPVAVSGGASRFIAHALGRREIEEVERVTTSVFAALIVASLVYLVIALVFAAFFERIFEVPSGMTSAARWSMLLAGIAGVARVPASAFQAGLNAAQQYVAINAREIALTILRAILIVLAFTVFTPSLVWVSGTYLVVEAAAALITWRLARRVVPWQRVRWSTFDWRTLLRVNAFSGWLLVGSLATLLYWRMDSIVINKLLDPTLVTGYSVVAAILMQTYFLGSLGISVVNPAATVLHATGDIARMARIIYRANRVTVALAVPALIFLMLFGSQVLALYLDSPDYEAFGILFSVLGSAMIVQLTQVGSRSVPTAFGKAALNNTVTLAFGAAGVGLSILFVVAFDMGIIGVAAGVALMAAASNILFWPFYTARLLGVRLRDFFLNSMVIPLAHCLPAAAILLASWVFGAGSSAAGLIAAFAVAYLLHGIYMLRFGLDRTDRGALVQALRRVRRRHTGLGGDA